MKLTDEEYRIFLCAMSKEREICKEIDKESGVVNLTSICDSITQKVKMEQKEPSHKCINIHDLTMNPNDLPPKDGHYIALVKHSQSVVREVKFEYDKYLQRPVFIRNNRRLKIENVIWWAEFPTE